MSSQNDYNYDPGANIRPHLSPGESLLWAGEPKKGLRLRARDTIMIPFSIAWFGFACFWEFMAFTLVKNWFFEAFGAVFVIIGFNFAIGRFFFDAISRARTTYGVTESRIIIKKPQFFTINVRSIDIRSISNLNFSEKSDGSGTIKFGNDIETPAIGRNNSFVSSAPSFEMIPHVRNVYDIISRQRNKKHNEPAS